MSKAINNNYNWFNKVNKYTYNPMVKIVQKDDAKV